MKSIVINNRHWSGLSLWLLAFVCLTLVGMSRADTPSQSISNLLAQSDLFQEQKKPADALKVLKDADKLSPNNAQIFCRMTRQYCDLMFTVKTKEEQKSLAEMALSFARRAVQADPKSPTAHLCVAVSCTKNFPFSDNQTKINYSREIKSETEQAIALDPKQDVSYYMLGRWHFEVANMGLLVRGLVRIAYGGLPKASNELAIQNFKKAIELAPNRIIHHFELAKVYHATGQSKLAQDEFAKCHDLTPVDADDTDAQREAIKQLDLLTGHKSAP